MPLHAYIKEMYNGGVDPLYFIRFLDYLIYKRSGEYTLSLKNKKVKPLITGILVDEETGTEYNSLQDFYTETTGKAIQPRSFSVFKEIMVSKEYSIWRIVCMVKEQEILEFIDQKYGTFLMFRDLRKRYKTYIGGSMPTSIVLVWNDNKYKLKRTYIESSTKNILATSDLLDAYHSGDITGLYYVTDKGSRILISDE